MKATKFRHYAVLMALVLLWASPALAQRGKWWQDDRFGRELGLTTEQRTHLEEIFQKNLPTLRQRMQTLDDAQAQFDVLVEKGDDTSVMNQVGVVEDARAELNKARTLMLLRMRRSLTTDQWAKFTALHEATQRDRDRDRPQTSTKRK
jgi:Spy/CpxP family protein refolding chaperone